jgi:hypothetical protein
MNRKRLLTSIATVLALTLVFAAAAQAAGGLKVSFASETNGAGTCELTFTAAWHPKPGQAVIHFALLDVTTGGVADSPDQVIGPTDSAAIQPFTITSTPGVFDSFVVAAQLRDGLGRELASDETKFQADCRIPGV